MKKYLFLALVVIAGVCRANGQENQEFTKTKWSHHISSTIGSSSTHIGGMVGIEYFAIKSDYIEEDFSIDLGIGASVATFVAPNSDMRDKILADILGTLRCKAGRISPIDWRFGVGYDFGKDVWRIKYSFGLGFEGRFISLRPAFYCAMPMIMSWGLIDIFQGKQDPNSYGMELTLGVKF